MKQFNYETKCSYTTSSAIRYKHSTTSIKLFEILRILMFFWFDFEKLIHEYRPMCMIHWCWMWINYIYKVTYLCTLCLLYLEIVTEGKKKRTPTSISQDLLRQMLLLVEKYATHSGKVNNRAINFSPIASTPGEISGKFCYWNEMQSIESLSVLYKSCNSLI